jgi:Cu(I)/Ag(I) efflux system membrane fusion protein
MKKTKWILSVVAIAALIFTTRGLTGCSKSAEQMPANASAVKYTCPMHPEVVQDKPGDCPKCGMKLVEKH